MRGRCGSLEHAHQGGGEREQDGGRHDALLVAEYIR